MSFYYSLGSRYSYLASTQIEKLERETGCEVVWNPLYSVDLYRLRGANPFEGEAISGQYDWDYRQYDAECWAEYYGAYYREPRGRVEFDPRLLARACVAAERLGAVRVYSKNMFSAMFVEDLTKIDRAQCVKRAEDIGLCRRQFVSELDSPEVERELEERALQARSEGAFGVPTFVVGGKMFFGNDRLPLLRHYLHGKERIEGPQPEEAEAAASLKSIARNEELKAHVMADRGLHEVFLRAARRFIGGEELAECLSDARSIDAEGFSVTIDYMGESAREERGATEATEEFLQVVDAIAKNGLDSSVSLDLSHIGLAIDEELCYENASRLAEKARDHGLEMMVSMEGSERTEQVLSMYHRLAGSFENVGITLQAYLHRTADDLAAALERPGRIRLVKGAFEEPAEAALLLGEETDAAYRYYLEKLLVAEHPCSIATHDPALLGHADRFIRENGVSGDRIEFEMLKGVQRERLAKMRDLGYRSRVYLPYGEEWYLCLCHRLAEHPPNIYKAIADAVGSTSKG